MDPIHVESFKYKEPVQKQYFHHLKIKTCIAFEQEAADSLRISYYSESGYFEKAFILSDSYSGSENVNFKFQIISNSNELILLAIESECTHLIYLNRNIHMLEHPKNLLLTMGTKLYIFSNPEYSANEKSNSFAVNLKSNKFIKHMDTSKNNDGVLSILVEAFAPDQITINRPSHILGRESLDFCGMMYSYTHNDMIFAVSTFNFNRFKSITDIVQLLNSALQFDFKFDFKNGCFSSDHAPQRLQNSVQERLVYKISALSNDTKCESNPSYQLDGKPTSKEWYSRDEIIQNGRSYLQKYLEILKSNKNTQIQTNTIGIVILAYDAVFIEVLFNIQYIRHHLYSKLQIEIYHFGEISPENKLSLESVEGVKVLNLDEIGPMGIKLTKSYKNNYHYKLSAILQSNFDKILYLDSDSIPIKDPEYLFHSNEFQEYGLMMWHDIWKTNRLNPIFDIFQLGCKANELEIEAGQWLINKQKHHNTLLFAYLILADHPFWMKVFFGDKDVLLWTAKYLMMPYYVGPSFMKSYGYKLKQFQCGHAMVHYFNGAPTFFHANLMKYAKHTIELKHFSGYQEYYTLTERLPKPKFYGFMGWKCVGLDESVFVEDPEDIRDFIIKYTTARKIVNHG